MSAPLAEGGLLLESIFAVMTGKTRMLLGITASTRVQRTAIIFAREEEYGQRSSSREEEYGKNLQDAEREEKELARFLSSERSDRCVTFAEHATSLLEDVIVESSIEVLRAFSAEGFRIYPSAVIRLQSESRLKFV
uniref:Prohibitin n=1 Tax=Steinernema glaseri TaxID=37863 RepID=A0A1I7XWG5_9BILA